MNLAFRFPIMFWNCACLISDAGGNEEGAAAEETEDEAKEETEIHKSLPTEGANYEMDFTALTGFSDESAEPNNEKDI